MIDSEKTNNVPLGAKGGYNTIKFIFCEDQCEFSYSDRKWEGGDLGNNDGVFNIRNVKLGVLWGSLMMKSKMRTRRLDKKIKDPWWSRCCKL